MPSMTRLLRLMREQQDHYDALRDLLVQKRTAIEHNDLRELARVAQDIERVIGRNSQVEGERQAAARQLATELGLPDHRPTIARIVRRLPEPDRAALLERRDRLTATLRALRAESQTVQGVLRLNVQLIDRLIKTMLNVGPVAATYDAEGESAAGDTLRLLDRTA